MSAVRYWLLCHPRVGRPLVVLGWLQLLGLVAVRTAPGAAASTNAAVLNWTGLHDTYGVAIGDFYLSLASFPDQLTQGGPDASAVDPSTWAPWLLHGLKVLYSTLTAANILTAEAGVFVGIIALSLWVMRLTISSYWLLMFGEIAKAVSTAVITVTTGWGLVAVTVPVGVFLGVLAIRRGEAGRGATRILVAIAMPAGALTVFADPAGMMYGPDGLLMFGRRMGFSTAQAVTHNGALSGAGLAAQVDALTSSLITHVVREPLEVFNFGHVVDTVGGCGAQYSAALHRGATLASVRGSSDGPVKAMARCGDVGAVYYAQNLDGTNVFVGLVLVLAALLFGWFMVSSGASVLMVSVKAIYTTAKLVPSVLAGGVSGAAQQHAKATVWRFFQHPLEAMVLITFVSVMGLAVERLIARPLPAELGGASPFAHILMMGGASMTALYLLRHIRADLHGHHPGPGLAGRAADVALGVGLRAALGGAGSGVVGGARGLRRALGGASPTPWERLEQASAVDPTQILGPPQHGFAAVHGEPGNPGAPPGVPATGPALSEPGALPASAPSVGRGEPPWALASPGPGQAATGAILAAAAGGSTILSAHLAPEAGVPGEVSAISADPAVQPPGGAPDRLPLTARVGHDGLPLQPAADDGPAPQLAPEPAPKSANVDSITDRDAAG